MSPDAIIKPECYSCPGYSRECRDYMPSADYDTCKSSMIARKDKERESTGNFREIVSGQNLAAYLYDNGEKIARVLRVLPKS